jgi:tetratricopeptide (TPR) repeat protein
MSVRAWMVAAVLVVLVGTGALVSRRLTRGSAAVPSNGLPSTTQAFWEAYQAASAARANGSQEQAAREYARALQIRPDHEDSLYYLGNCYLEQRAYRRALAAYERLTALNPNGSSRASMQSGLVYASLDPAAPVDLAAAERSFARALALDPDSGALLGLAEVAVLRGRWSRAQELLLQVEADNKMGLAAPYLLGFLAYRSGDSRKAWYWFTTAIGRGELKKPPIKWTEEGDVRGGPALRWRALARQSVFGGHWLRLRDYLKPPGARAADLARSYSALARELEAFSRAHPSR